MGVGVTGARRTEGEKGRVTSIATMKVSFPRCPFLPTTGDRGEGQRST